MRRSVVSDGLRLPFSMSQMVVARMSTFSESSARVMPRDLRWALMAVMISSCVMIIYHILCVSIAAVSIASLFACAFSKSTSHPLDATLSERL